MFVKKIKYLNYRNIDKAEIIPDPCVTVLSGRNGQGKTNALEGIYMFSGMRSFRTQHDSELVNFDATFAELKLDYNNGIRSCTMSQRYVPSIGKRFTTYNGINITKMSETVGNFKTVLFCPEHLSIVRDGPSERRRFLDTAISQTDSVYLKTLQNYKHILSQRNALIALAKEKKDDKVFSRTGEMWSVMLAEQSEVISKTRHEYVKKLNQKAGAILSDMSQGKEKAVFKYRHPRTRADFLKLLTENVEREIRAGVTLYGAHKDDIDIYLNDREARFFASQGQQRSIALAMKMAEGDIVFDITDHNPVLLLDDILSELDSTRREYLLSGFGNKQVIITSCDDIKFSAKVYRVEEGKIFEA